MADAITQAPSPQTHIIVGRMGGAIAKCSSDATAFARRQEPYFTWILGVWPPELPDEPGRAWTRQVSDALQPFVTGATYVNALGDEGDARIREAYSPATYDRLVALKRKYDPTNLFRLNQNIKP